jgi:ribosomal protein S4
MFHFFAPLFYIFFELFGKYQQFKVRKEFYFMSQLNQQELQSLRHLIGAHETAYQKLQTYAQSSSDQQVKSFFEKSAMDAQKTKQQLLSFLN